MTLAVLMAFLPTVFLFHDFEEIILMRRFLDRNGSELATRYSWLRKLLSGTMSNLSTAGFALSVFVIFLAITLATVLSLLLDLPWLWFAAFSVLSVHFVLHILSVIVYGKYAPVLITSVLALPYSVYTGVKFFAAYPFSWSAVILWFALGLVISAAVMRLAFAAGLRFERWLRAD